MPTIHRLPTTLQHKIAAGEVVERPASVVKELVENAVDAGARQIDVTLINGGIDKIVVADDGCGMQREDLMLALERYATSKIQEEADLFRIGTLGFRGEALSSIAAVSAFEIVTKARNDDATAAIEGSRLSIEGGVDPEITPIGAAPGTVMTVSRLFFNTPVRRKYLKTVNTENQHSISVVADQALVHKDIGFRLISNGKTVLNAPAVIRWFDRVVAVLGKEWATGLLPVDFEMAPWRVTGFVGRPEQARSSRRNQYLYVNQRRIEDPVLGYRVKDAFGRLLDPASHPVFVLNIDAPPDRVDVNVHPRKAQVKFQNPRDIYTLVNNAVEMALAAHDLVPRVQAPHTNFTKKTTLALGENDFSRWEKREEQQHSTQRHYPSLPQAAEPRAEHYGEDAVFGNNFPQSALPVAAKLTPLAQLYASYILAEREGEHFLIDQHAAQERAMYERFLKFYQTKTVPQTQPLLMPETVELSASETAALDPALPFLNDLGIDITLFGGQEFRIRSVPVELAGANLAKLIRGVVDELLLEKSPHTISQKIEEKLIMRACKISIKAGERLSLEQMQIVLDDLLACDRPYTCPHGRPTIIKLEKETLEKWFGRR